MIVSGIIKQSEVESCAVTLYERLKLPLMSTLGGDFVVAIGPKSGAYVAGHAQEAVKQQFTAEHPNAPHVVFLMGTPAD